MSITCRSIRCILACTLCYAFASVVGASELGAQTDRQGLRPVLGVGVGFGIVHRGAHTSELPYFVEVNPQSQLSGVGFAASAGIRLASGADVQLDASHWSGQDDQTLTSIMLGSVFTHSAIRPMILGVAVGAVAVPVRTVAAPTDDVLETTTHETAFAFRVAGGQQWRIGDRAALRLLIMWTAAFPSVEGVGGLFYHQLALRTGVTAVL